MFNFKSFFRDPKVVVSAQHLKEAIDVSGVGIILDVRGQEEFLKGHIKGSTSLPNNELKFKISSIVPLKTTRIFCYCNDGDISYASAKELQGMGYQLAFSIEGGLKAWQAKGYELTQ